MQPPGCLSDSTIEVSGGGEELRSARVAEVDAVELYLFTIGFGDGRSLWLCLLEELSQAFGTYTNVDFVESGGGHEKERETRSSSHCSSK